MSNPDNPQDADIPTVGVPESFSLKDKLGQTGFSETWLAFDRVKKKRFVFHRITASIFSSEFHLDHFFSSCARQIPLIAKSGASTFLNILQYGTEDGDTPQVWFAREAAIDVKSLDETVRTGKTLRPAEAAKRFASLCAVLQILHRNDLIFRNWKPSNLFIGPADVLFLTDADVCGFRCPNVMQANYRPADYGNINFLPPELTPNHPNYTGVATAATDIWGVGALLGFSLSGLLPSQFDLSKFPRDAAAIIEKSTVPSSQQRYSCLDAMRDDLFQLQKAVRESVFAGFTPLDSTPSTADPVAESVPTKTAKTDSVSLPPIAPVTQTVPVSVPAVTVPSPAPVPVTPTSPAMPITSPSTPPLTPSAGTKEIRVPTAGPSTSVTPACPQCGTPYNPNHRMCPNCKRPYEEPCLNCHSSNPFWLKICRGCGNDLSQLKQRTTEKLQLQQKQVLKLRELYAHEKAQIIVKMMMQVTHPDFQSYREWARNLLPVIQKERKDVRNYIDGIRAHAKGAMEEQKYERVVQIIDQVPPNLLDEQFRKLREEASECIVEVESLIREIRNALVSKQYGSLLATVQRYIDLKANDPEARALQEKIEKLTTITSPSGGKFRRIPSGKFYMGSHESDIFIRNNERPQHRVNISKSFFISIYLISQAEFARVMGFNSSLATENPLCPVDNVTWFTATEYCNKLSEEEGLSPYYQLDNIKRRSTGTIDTATVTVLGGVGYRLPTEAEWEYACRAGSITPWSFGDQVVEASMYAWYFDNSQNETHPVGQKKPNAWGLYDMHGNVMEWCYDWYDEFYYQHSNDSDDPIGPENGVARVLRGGAWQFGAEATRSPYRNSSNPESGSSVVGFRVVRNETADAPSPSTPPESEA